MNFPNVSMSHSLLWRISQCLASPPLGEQEIVRHFQNLEVPARVVVLYNKEVKYCFTNQHFRTLSRKNQPATQTKPRQHFLQSLKTCVIVYTVYSMLFEKACPETFVQSSELNKENIIHVGKHVF